MLYLLDTANIEAIRWAWGVYPLAKADGDLMAPGKTTRDV